MKKLAVLLILLLLPTAGLAEFSIKFENTQDHKMTYMLYWIDNPFELEKPFSMAGGELNAQQSREIRPLKAGDYLVVWYDQNKSSNNVKMKIEKGVTFVTVTPKTFNARH